MDELLGTREQRRSRSYAQCRSRPELVKHAHQIAPHRSCKAPPVIDVRQCLVQSPSGTESISSGGKSFQHLAVPGSQPADHYSGVGIQPLERDPVHAEPALACQLEIFSQQMLTTYQATRQTLECRQHLVPKRPGSQRRIQHRGKLSRGTSPRQQID